MSLNSNMKSATTVGAPGALGLTVRIIRRRFRKNYVLPIRNFYSKVFDVAKREYRVGDDPLCTWCVGNDCPRHPEKFSQKLCFIYLKFALGSKMAPEREYYIPDDLRCPGR